MQRSNYRLVLRKEIRYALQQGRLVSILNDPVNRPLTGEFYLNAYWVASINRGRFRIGCMRFAAREAKIIRKWALG
jgi:hypothetical protein